MTLKRKINEIVDSINFNNTSAAVLTGLSGECLFTILNSKLKQQNSILYYEESIQNILDIIKQSHDYPYTFCDGLAGTAWFFDFLKENKIVDIDDDFFDDIDDVLINAGTIFINHGNYDFLHGVGGIILTLLHRTESNRGHLIKLVQRLLSIRINYRGTKTWRFITHENSINNQFQISLGLSHGLPSLMVLLSKCIKQDICPEECNQAISETYNFIHNYRNKQITPTDYSYYPSIINNHTDYNYQSRLGWCYGDLSIASGFLVTGTNIGNTSMIAEAQEIYKYYAEAQDRKEFGIKDAGFCHGASGLAYLFHKMYQRDKCEEYKTAYKYWLKRTLDLSNHTNGLAGYKTFKGEKGWVNSQNLIDGIAGIGSVLCTLECTNQYHWDECFLLS